MKKLLVIGGIALLFSCKEAEKKEPLYPEPETPAGQTPVELGQALIEKKGNCFACHKPDQKIIGPSIEEIATVYKSNNGNIIQFLKGEGKPLVDPSQYEVMKANFAITKNMSDTELEALEAYIYSHLK